MSSLILRLDLHEDAQQSAEALSRDLRAALLECPEVQTAEARALPPEMAIKGAAAIDWNTILVALASGGALSTLIAALQAWVQTRRQVSVTVELDGDTLTIVGRGPYSEEQRMAIEQFRARHKGFVLLHE